jgi:hypothetical protein
MTVPEHFAQDPHHPRGLFEPRAAIPLDTRDATA